MTNINRRRKRLQTPDESSPLPSPTQQQSPKRSRTGGKTVPTRPVTRSRTRPSAPAASGFAHAVAVSTRQVVHPVASSDDGDDEKEDDEDEDEVDEDEDDEEREDDDDDDADDHDGDEDDDEDEEEDEEEDDSQDEDYEDESNGEDNDEKRWNHENKMLLQQFLQEGESDEHGDDEASSQEDSDQDRSSQNVGREAPTPARAIDEEEVEEGEEPEMLETNDSYQRFFSRRDFDGDDSSSAMGGFGGAGSTSSSSSSSSSSDGDNNYGYGNSAFTPSSLSSSSAPQGRSRYTSGRAGDGGQFRNRSIHEPLLGTSLTHPIEIDSPPQSEDGDDDDEIPRGRYQPEHFIVRERISNMYRLLAHNEKRLLDQTPPTSPTSPLSASRILALSQALSIASRSLNTVSDLMDLLIRTHLPQFWLYRAKNKYLNRFARKQPKNPRPRESTLLATCVDYRFPHTGTHFKNSHLSPQDIDDIFNNNRQEENYDGNIDHFGLKEEGHHADCPTNFYSKTEKGTKLHFGWDLVVGYQHFGVPKFPNPQRTIPPPPHPHKPHCRSLAPPGMPTPSPSPSSSPPRTPKSGSGAPPPPSPPPQLQPQPRPHTYYPARSLMASFCHLLPRDLELTTNQIRKLFTYFVWHPWFDCDFQAITIRRAYEELWPLFLLRDEDEEVEEQEEDEEYEMILEMKRKKRLEAELKKKQEAAGKKKSGKSAVKRKQRAPKAPAPPKTPAYIEYKRQTQMETRFTTSFERGLINHGVIRTIRNRTLEEYTRAARQVRKGWVFGPRSRQYQDQGQTAATSAVPHISHFEKVPTYPGTIHTFSANDRTLVEKGGKLYFEPDEVYPEQEIPKFQNKAWTRPDCADALDRLKREVKEWWDKEAEAQRQNLGFVLPEFARVRRWPAGKLEMVAGKLVFELDASVVEMETTTTVAKTKTSAKTISKILSDTTKPLAKTTTTQVTTRTFGRRRVNMDVDFSPIASRADRPVTGFARTTRSVAAARRESAQSQVQDLDMDVEMTSTSALRAHTQPSWGPTRLRQGQLQQPQQYRVQNPDTTSFSISRARIQSSSAATTTTTMSRQDRLQQPQLKRRQVQPPFITAIPSTNINNNSNVNAITGTMAGATQPPTTFPSTNTNAAAGPMAATARPPITFPSADTNVTTVAGPMAATGPSTTFPLTNVNTVAGPMGSVRPLTSAYNSQAISVDDFISDLTNPKADYWEMYMQRVQSGRSNGLNLANSSAVHQTLSATAATSLSQPLHTSASFLLTPAELSAQYFSSRSELNMASQGTLSGHAAAASVPVSGMQNNAVNDMSQFLNMSAMEDTDNGTSSSSSPRDVNDLNGGFTRMDIADRPTMMDYEMEEDPEVARQAAKLSGTELWFENQGGQNRW
ncbi:hypothetical protein BG015_002454 [Linnemannia schmuckeri]|uniref:Uncharacterized protein n=1 Tax=Linnemannia schmuckeri TaxID=64567 RepID=A0A9P5VDP7_9FUNG|nr:hypothetical protein BG015_002454 [Linnemannia schmuckeri]